MKTKSDAARILVTLCTIITDILMLALAAFLASLIRYGTLDLTTTESLSLPIIVAYVVISITVGGFHYNKCSGIRPSIQKSFYSLIGAFLISVVAAFALKQSVNYSRLETGYMVFSAAFLLTITRSALVVFLYSKLLPLLTPSTVLITTNSEMTSGNKDLSKKYNVNKIINIENMSWNATLDDPNMINDISRNVNPYERIILYFNDKDLRFKWTVVMRFLGVNAELLEDGLQRREALQLSSLNGYTTIVFSRPAMTSAETIIKRTFDISLVIISFPLWGPLMALISILVKIDSPGPAFFMQTRIGMGNRHYVIYKFRTMYTDQRDFLGSISTSRSDGRVTKVGKILRKSSLDELPQLLNVLRGDMSLVGPRPHPVGMKSGGKLNWEVDNLYWARHTVKPGITGLAQVRGLRGSTETEEDLLKRVEADLEYINNWSIFNDIVILAKTVKVIFHHNAY